MKQKTVFVCKECGYEAVKWLGKCPSCGTYMSMIEEKAEEPQKKAASGKATELKTLNAIDMSVDETRTSSGSRELDRVLGGGIVRGSLVLCGGEPGIGKSTLLLQVASFCAEGETVVYISGEESEKQIKIRAERLGVGTSKMLAANETDLNAILAAIDSSGAKTVIVDSIQTIYSSELSSAPGSVGQVRECTLSFMRVAKEKGITFFIVGHVTKEGAIAGPRVLEHMVDCVLYFEGERHQSYRIVRAVKNRFGSTDEIGVFEMRDKGLVDVPNPSLMLLSGRPIDVPGSAVVCAVEGTRPILSEIQALCVKTSFAMPRRTADGVDFNRLTLLCAVIEKALGYRMSENDVYINVTGGIRIPENACDLAIAAAIISCCLEKPLPEDMAFFGEVGLTGEVRTVTMAQRRLTEAAKMGFGKCMMPFDALGSIEKNEIEIVSVKNLGDVVAYVKGM
ncbi:MAG: DNA repair protein RadA [Clostridia bacterium]|nr:DNA repair protein RadA [Clostridia bacterium]